jgi:WD40 repeat protein
MLPGWRIALAGWLWLAALAACDIGAGDSGDRATAATDAGGSGASPTTGTLEMLVVEPAATLDAFESSVAMLAWSPDGRTIAAGPDGFSPAETVARLWSATGEPLATLEHPDAVTALAWSPAGTSIATGSAGGRVYLWDPDGTPGGTIDVATGDTASPIAALAWSPDGALLASATTRSVQPATPGPVSTLPAVIQLWRRDGELAAAFEVQETFRGFVNLAWSADGALLAAGSVDYHVWRTDGTEVFSVTDTTQFGPAGAMALSPDGRYLVLAHDTGQLRVHPLDGGAPVTVDGYSGVLALAFAPDGRTLAVTTSRAVRLLQVDNPFATPVDVQPTGTQAGAVWSPDGDQLAAGSLRRVVFVYSSAGLPFAQLAGCASSATSLAWSAGGASVAGGFDDGRVCVWQIPVSPGS